MRLKIVLRTPGVSVHESLLDGTIILLLAALRLQSWCVSVSQDRQRRQPKVLYNYFPAAGPQVAREFGSDKAN